MSLHILISGFVQNVGYRQFVKKTAISLGLTGWVKNLPDRRVEVFAVGTKEALKELITKCKSGPFLAKVSNIQADWSKNEEVFDGFSIVV
jgi:acylphosphatase